MSDNKKQSSKDSNLAITSAVNRIFNDEVKNSIIAINDTVLALSDKNLDCTSKFIFHTNQETQGLDDKDVNKIKKALKAEAKLMESVFTFNDKGKCDLFEKLSAFTFSDFVKKKIKDKTSVKAIRKALDKLGIKGLKGAVKMHQDFNKKVNGITPSNNRPDTDKIVSSAEKMDSLNLSKSDVKEALMLLPIGEALDICKEFLEANVTEVKKVS